MNTAPPASGTSRLDLARLQALAQAHRIGTSFSGWDRQPHDVAPETLVKILAALGVKAGTDELLDAALEDAGLASWRRMLPPAVVGRAGTETLVPVHVRHGEPVRLWIEAEDGGRHHPVQRDVWVNPQLVDGVLTGRATFELPRDLPLGWHVLHAVSGDRQTKATLVVVPQRLSTAAPLEQRRGWGLAAQLYSVRSQRSWGIGDIADLADLAAIAGARGAGLDPRQPAARGRAAPAGRRPRPTCRRPGGSSTRSTCASRPSRSWPTCRKPRRPGRTSWPSRREPRQPGAANDWTATRHTRRSWRRSSCCTPSRAVPRASSAFAAFRAQQGPGWRTSRCGARCARSATPDDEPMGAATRRARPRRRSGRARLADRIDFHCWLQWLLRRAAGGRPGGGGRGLRHAAGRRARPRRRRAPAGRRRVALRDVLAPGPSVGRAAGHVQPAGPGLVAAAVAPAAAGRGRLRAVPRHAAHGAAPRRGHADRPYPGAVPAVVGARGHCPRTTAPTSTTTTRR